MPELTDAEWWGDDEAKVVPKRASLRELSDMAPQGIWVAFTESQLAGTIAEAAGQPIAACYDISWTGVQHPRPDTARFIAELVNAYREGRLVEKEPGQQKEDLK